MNQKIMLYFHKGFRKRGIASSFIEQLIQQKKDVVAFELEVMPANENALHLYLKRGFKLDRNRHLIWER